MKFPSKIAGNDLLTNACQYCLINRPLMTHQERQAALIFRKAMIAHDKGKPVARQGRKAVSLH
jgi:hypothetical protein